MIYFQVIDMNSFSLVDLESNEDNNKFDINIDDEQSSIVDTNENSTTPKKKRKRRSKKRSETTNISNIYKYS